MKRITFLAVTLLLCFSIESYAQFEKFENLEESTTKGFWANHFKDFFKVSNFVDLSTPLALTGGFNAETRFYNAQGIDPQQSPLYWFISGNVNAKVYAINIPVSFLLATDRQELTKPQGPQLPNLKEKFNNRFTRIGASPTYKWATLHVGHRAMDFSNLTLAGLPFYGVGTELNPGKVRMSFFKGRLADAKPRDLSLLEPNLPIFSRTGWGGKIGYGDSDNHIDLMVVRGSDDHTSIPITSDFPTTPLSNTVYGLRGRKQIGKFSVEGEYASSATTTNTFDAVDGSLNFPFSFLGEEKRANTITGGAFDGGINFATNGFVLGAQYKRVDNGYQSVGIPFINTDVEEYNGNFSSSLLEGALQYNITAGLQRDNLSGLKDQVISRFIYSMNANYGSGPFTVGVNYNNNAFTTDYILSTGLDSLDVVAVTRNGGVNLGYNFTTDGEYSHSFVVSATLSDISDDLDFSNAESTMYNATFTYGFTTPSNWSFNGTAGLNKTESPQNTFNRMLFGFGMRKSFLEDKFAISAQGNFFTVDLSQGGNQVKNNALNAVAELSYNLSEKHTLYTRGNLISRSENLSANAKTITETIYNLGYRMNFSYIKTAKATQNDEN